MRPAVLQRGVRVHVRLPAVRRGLSLVLPRLRLRGPRRRIRLKHFSG